MRIFAWEYVTAGGWRECAASRSLIAEGMAMLGALVRDLARIPNVEAVIARDRALALPDLPAQSRIVDSRRLWESWREIASEVDAVWPIAPETDGLLERARALVQEAGRPVLASQPDALATARSKRATAQQLAARGVRVVACAPLGGALPASNRGWVVKPDDGAGSDQTYLAADQTTVTSWCERLAGRDFIIQPFLAGPPLSLSMLAQDGAAWLLSCNTQRMRCDDGVFAYCGGSVGGAESRRSALQTIAAGVAAALPGLWGYIGIDLIDSPEGPIVLEVNPRLTTSYVGLSDSLDLNAAELVLALRTTKLRNLIRPLAPRAVAIDVPAVP